MINDTIFFWDKSIREIIDVCLSCETLEEAEIVLYQYEDFCISTEVAHRNLGYMFEYCNEEERKKLYRLFPVDHPIFGHKFGREPYQYSKYFKKK